MFLNSFFEILTKMNLDYKIYVLGDIKNERNR
jgi:hypothetical protein